MKLKSVNRVIKPAETPVKAFSEHLNLKETQPKPETKEETKDHAK